MAFQKLLAFTKKVADLADQPTLTPTELKNQFDAAPDELRQSFNTLVDDLNTLNPASATQENWINITLQNGWVPEATSVTPKYFKDNFGRVYVKGRIKNGTTSTFTTLFTLPVGYRPNQQLILVANSEDGTTGSSIHFPIIVNPDGTATTFSTIAKPFIHLDSIQFKAEV